MTDEQLADLRARITKGPWQAGSIRSKASGWYGHQVGPDGFAIALVAYSDKTPEEHMASIADRDAIALVPDLLDEVLRLREENKELHRKLGGGCDYGGNHIAIKQGGYSFCANCGETLKGIRYCHEPRAALGGAHD